MADLFVALLVLVGALALFATTRPGRRWASRLLGQRPAGAGGRLSGKKASDDDHAYLLRICEGDYERLRVRLQDELKINPHLSEAEAYRKAIRRHMKGGS